MLDGEELGKLIASILVDPGVPASMRKTLTDTWIKIGKAICQYFAANGNMIVTGDAFQEQGETNLTVRGVAFWPTPPDVIAEEGDHGGSNGGEGVGG